MNIDELKKEIIQLKSENHDLKEQLQNYIPRRRVRRVYKSLKTILESDIENDTKKYKETLIKFVNKIEKEGEQKAGQEIKTAIEHLISVIDI